MLSINGEEVAEIFRIIKFKFSLVFAGYFNING